MFDNLTTDDWTGRFERMAQEQGELDTLRAETATLRQALLEAAADIDARAAVNERLRAVSEGLLYQLSLVLLSMTREERRRWTTAEQAIANAEAFGLGRR